MPYVEWNDGMSVQVAVIDEQHQRLFRLVNELHDAMTRGQGTMILEEIIDGLIEYTRSHFATEEGYFETCGYPGCEAHKREHQDFVAKVTDFGQGFAGGRLLLTLDIMNFLGDWLVNHVLASDASYAPFLNPEGVS